jgi:hypothetical protein
VFFGHDLMLPAAGFRSQSGWLEYRGTVGNYWSSTHSYFEFAPTLHISSSNADTYSNGYRGSGFSVRCIAE